jgi:uncharacterized protein
VNEIAADSDATIILTKPPEEAPAQPIAEKERIVSLDVLRGVAVLGILVMNIQYFATIPEAYTNPTAYGDLAGASFWVWFVEHVFADEKFMTIFSMLFGAGILIMTSHVEAAGKASAPLHYRRMAWLILFGCMHAYLIWSGDILFTYGVCGMMAYLFRKMAPIKLLLIGLGFLAVAVVFDALFYYVVHYQQTAAEYQATRDDLWAPGPEAIQKTLAAFRGNWLEQMRARVRDSLQMETGVIVAYSFWRVTGGMLWGMALFKLGVLSATRPRSFYWKLVAAGLLVGVPVICLGTSLDVAHGWSFDFSFFVGNQFNYWASLLVALGWVGAVMLAFNTAWLNPLTRRLAAAGRMAFSNYILETLICTTIFYGHGFGLYGKVDRMWQLPVVLGVWAVILVVSPIWFRHFYFGPLEWLWRSLTYRQLEPFKRTQEPMENSHAA